MSMDARAFRDTLGRFPTGVTVITTRGLDGRLYGVTIGSFTSLSLDPPLVLFSLDRSALCYPSFTTCTHFTVNVLAEDQTELSSVFASQDERPWDDLDFAPSPVTGAPRLAGCLAYIDCTHEARHPGGDHDIFVGGAVDVAISDADGRPLIHFGGAYRRLLPTALD